MEAKHTIKYLAFAWPLLAVASFALGVAVSDAAATLGITNFAQDHRGEWGLIITPILTLFAFASGVWPYRYLRRNLKNTAPVVAAITITVLSCAWITWHFARGA